MLTALFFVGLDMADGEAFLHSVDDEMRALQIIDLLGDQNWRDMSQPYLQMPQTYVSPWSRIVDFPYIVAIWLFGLVVGQQMAINLAFLAVPPIMLIGFCAVGRP